MFHKIKSKLYCSTFRDFTPSLGTPPKLIERGVVILYDHGKISQSSVESFRHNTDTPILYTDTPTMWGEDR